MKSALTLDARTHFEAVMNQANTLNVDAVIHAGDIFDHVATGADRSFVSDALTSEFRMPFFYIYGNHDETASRRAIDSATADVSGIERLSRDGEPLGDGDATLFGIDYSYDTFPGEPLNPSVHSVRSNANVLIVHDTPYPVRNDLGARLHEQRGADFREAIEQTSVNIDLIVCGHMHVGQLGTLEDFQIPVLVTGAPAPINSGNANNNPSTWLLRVTEDGIDEITRHAL